MDCTITKYLEIAPAEPRDYKNLARFHYRSGKLGPAAAMYKLIDTHPRRREIEPVVGIIIYSMPCAAVQLRNIATDGLFSRLGKSPALQLINNNVRTISRVVIEPRYRGLGLAKRLVAETLDKLNMPYIEALAVMGRVNPFFERAGMLKFIGKEHARTVKLREALSIIGIEGKDLVDVELVNDKLSNASAKTKAFIEKHITEFLAAYGRRGRRIPAGPARTQMIIDKLGDRPIYYLWRNSNVKLRISK